MKIIIYWRQQNQPQPVNYNIIDFYTLNCPSLKHVNGIRKKRYKTLHAW